MLTKEQEQNVIDWVKEHPGLERHGMKFETIIQPNNETYCRLVDYEQKRAIIIAANLTQDEITALQVEIVNLLCNAFPTRYSAPFSTMHGTKHYFPAQYGADNPNPYE